MQEDTSKARYFAQYCCKIKQCEFFPTACNSEWMDAVSQTYYRWAKCDRFLEATNIVCKFRPYFSLDYESKTITATNTSSAWSAWQLLSLTSECVTNRIH